MYPDFVFLRRREAAIWIDRAYSEPAFIERLTDADSLFAEADCQIVKDQRKIKIGRLTVAVAGQPRRLFVKRYNAFSLRYKLASPFMRSGAYRSLCGAAILHGAEIACARPVAAVENRKGGALTKSFFLSEEIAGGETADSYWRGRLLDAPPPHGLALRRRFLEDLGRLFKTLHGAMIYHNDLKDANILAVGEPGGAEFRFVLLDLDGVARMACLSRRRKIKNLVQINRTLGRYLRRAEKLFFLKNYLGSAFSAPVMRRQLVRGILMESGRLDRLAARRG